MLNQWLYMYHTIYFEPNTKSKWVIIQLLAQLSNLIDIFEKWFVPSEFWVWSLPSDLIISDHLDLVYSSSAASMYTLRVFRNQGLRIRKIPSRKIPPGNFTRKNPPGKFPPMKNPPKLFYPVCR